jgi:hypothetical protein
VVSPAEPQDTKEGHGMIEDAPNLYFVLSQPHTMVPLRLLRATKPPGSQPDSVLRAEQRMLQAAEGNLRKRDPLTVRLAADGMYSILDGNATYGVAVRNNWAALPVTIVGDLEDESL